MDWPLPMLIPLITRFLVRMILRLGIQSIKEEFPTLIREIQSVDINVESINYDLTELVAGWHGNTGGQEINDILQLSLDQLISITPTTMWWDTNSEDQTIGLFIKEGFNSTEIIETGANLIVNSVNDSPELTGQQATLADGTENTPYTINESDLLQGYSDVENDNLYVDFLPTTNGSLTDNYNGTWTFTPDADYTGKVDLNYNVVDENGGSVAATQSFNLQAVDDIPAIEIIDNGDGTWTILAPDNFNKSVNLTFDINDGNGGIKTVTQNINFTPVNDDPELTGIQAILADGTEDTSYTINASDLLQGYSDVDGDTLSVNSLSATNGLLTENNNGTWTFTPTPDYNGSVDLTYNVIDDNGGSVAATQSFNLQAVNDAPELTGQKATLADGTEDTAYTINASDLLQGYSDSDGDTLSVDSLSATNGSLTDNNNGTWTFTPNADYNGTIDLTYNVVDGNGGSVAATQAFNLADTPEPIDLSIKSHEEWLNSIWGPGSNGLNLKADDNRDGINSSTTPGIGWSMNINDIYLTSFSIYSDDVPHASAPLGVDGTKNFNFLTYDGLNNTISVSAPNDAYLQVIDLTNLSTVASGMETVDFLPEANTVYGGLAWYQNNDQKYMVIHAMTDKSISWELYEGNLNNDPISNGSYATLNSGTQNQSYIIDSEDLLQGYYDKDGDELFVNGLKAVSYSPLNSLPDGLFVGDQGTYVLREDLKYNVGNGWIWDQIYGTESTETSILQVIDNSNSSKFWVQTSKDVRDEITSTGQITYNDFTYEYISDYVDVFEDTNLNNILDSEDTKLITLQFEDVDISQAPSQGTWSKQDNDQYPIVFYDLNQVPYYMTTIGTEIATVSSPTYTSPGQYIFEPQADDLGQVDLLYTVNDDNNGSVAATQSFNLQASNHAPTDIEVSSLSFIENMEPGSIVGRLTTVDQDLSDSHFYSLVEGTGDSDNGLFIIEGDSLILKSGVNLNYELQDEYSIRISTNDSGSKTVLGNSFEKIITFQLSDLLDSGFNYHQPINFGTYPSSSTWDDLEINSPYISGLLTGSKWGNYDPDNGYSTDLHYYFGEGTLFDVYGYSWTAYESDIAINAMKAYSDVGNITFTPSPLETGGLDNANIIWTLLDNTDAEDALGWAYTPESGDYSGITAMNWEVYESQLSEGILEPGSYYYLTFTHELGHALGLKHPHDHDDPYPVFPGVTAQDDGGDYELNAPPWTIMGYNDLGSNEYIPNYESYSGYPIGLGAFDIAAIQYLYGPNLLTATDDSTYKLDSLLNGYQTIWDNGGIDVIDASESESSVNIFLTNATLQTEEGGGGFVSSTKKKIQRKVIQLLSTLRGLHYRECSWFFILG